LFFGYLPLFTASDFPYDFERLHIFFFNLCSGGTILLYYTENRKKLSSAGTFFLMAAVGYAIFAFFKIYLPAIIIGLILAGIVEKVRMRRFSPLPLHFFQSGVPVAEKFHQAALLCLSIGLLISSGVILNNEFLHFISLPTLKLDTFFLGFSFPLSLITMSIMFGLMKTTDSFPCCLKHIAFWAVNLGVIIFLVFILFEKMVLQLMIATFLALTVLLVFYLFHRYAHPLQQKHFLLSGMGFLAGTAITGILYILLSVFPHTARYHEQSHFILQMHTFLSLYGWNLTGIAIIARLPDFPIRLDSKFIITSHWIIVALLAPLGNYLCSIAILVTLCYIFFIYLIFFSPKSSRFPMH
jgi:hypothetical protein